MPPHCPCSFPGKLCDVLLCVMYITKGCFLNCFLFLTDCIIVLIQVLWYHHYQKNDSWKDENGKYYVRVVQVTFILENKIIENVLGLW